MWRLSFLLLLGAFGSIGATTRHVPVDYPTIQAALDVLIVEDTVLVDTGVYVEALVAPSISFVLRGNVNPGPGDYPRPVIDPSSLPNPTGRTCLRQDSGSVIIEDMLFRNRWPMYPHHFDTTGGIRHPHGEITLRRCVFDSTFNALSVYYADVIAENCDFRNISGACIRTTHSVKATDCNFHSNLVEWAQISSWGNSLIERCHFSGNYGNQSILNMSGVNTQVRDCVFGPGVAESGERFYFSAASSIFEHNVIEDWDMWQGIFYSDVNSAGPLYIRHNVIRNCAVPAGHPEVGLTGFQLEMSVSCDSCFIAFDSNEVVDCTGNWGAQGLDVWGGHVLARANRFTRLFPTAVMNRDPQLELRDNLFYDNGVALESDTNIVTDARWNWWGDSTGPYHATINPNGGGDVVHGNVELIPWRTDTTFFPNGVPEQDPPLPRDLTLSVYPNPFNPTATLQFAVPEPGEVMLTVFNVNGQQVKELVNRRYEAGRYTLAFNGDELPSGIYFARLWTANSVTTQKLVLMK